jgi:hypothetical protein
VVRRMRQPREKIGSAMTVSSICLLVSTSGPHLPLIRVEFVSDDTIELCQRWSISDVTSDRIRCRILPML